MRNAAKRVPTYRSEGKANCGIHNSQTPWKDNASKRDSLRYIACATLATIGATPTSAAMALLAGDQDDPMQTIQRI